MSCSASAVSLKLFKFVHRIPLPLFSAAKRSFEPTCHSAGRSTSMWLQTSLRWANIHAACPCSAYCLGTQTGHKQDNLIVPRCVPHGSVLSGFADGELSGVLPPDLLTWWQPGGLIKLQLTWFMHKNRLNVRAEHSVISVSCFLFCFSDMTEDSTGPCTCSTRQKFIISYIQGFYTSTFICILCYTACILIEHL